eukprot:10919219-Alexandrium_andersonii.AAC.1
MRNQACPDSRAAWRRKPGTLIACHLPSSAAQMLRGRPRRRGARRMARPRTVASLPVEPLPPTAWRNKCSLAAAACLPRV